MVGWHHCLNGHEFEQALEDSERADPCHAAVHGLQRVDSLEKTLLLGKIDGRRRRG